MTVCLVFISLRNTTAFSKLTRANNLQIQQGFSALTTNDRNNYILNVDQISGPHGLGTRDYPSNQLHIDLILRLNNNSNDTLKYLMNYVSWSDIFKVNNSLLNIYKVYVGTNPNPPVINILPPHKSKTFNIPINYNKTKISSGLPFKVGMEIFKFTNKRQLVSFNIAKNLRITDTANLIWSNTILIPK